MGLVFSSVDARTTKRNSVGKVHFAPVVHSFTAFAADDARARVAGSVLVAESNLYRHRLKQLFFGGFAISSHLALVLVLDFRVTLVR
jgi:hypothetical protein